MEDTWAFKYGYCPPDCLTHNEAMRNNWKTDETFKMTLQYDNSILLTGLQFYVKLFFGILSFSLILTTVLTSIGKIMVQLHFTINVICIDSSYGSYKIRKVRAEYPLG